MVPATAGPSTGSSAWPVSEWCFERKRPPMTDRIMMANAEMTVLQKMTPS